MKISKFHQLNSNERMSSRQKLSYSTIILSVTLVLTINIHTCQCQSLDLDLARKYNNDLYHGILKGKVKSIFLYESKDGKERKLIRKVYFDTLKNIIEYENNISNPNVNSKSYIVKRKYSGGNCIEETGKDYQIIYSYDNNKLISEISTNIKSGQKIYARKYYYNKMGQRIKSERLS